MDKPKKKRRNYDNDYNKYGVLKPNWDDPEDVRRYNHEIYEATIGHPTRPYIKGDTPEMAKKRYGNKSRQYYHKLKQNPERHQQQRDKQKQWRKHTKQTIISYYGGKCACCGENRIEFLSIDHIDGGGAEHRRSLGRNGRGTSFYKWIMDNNYPQELQVLCFNCNLSLGFHGYCPHQTDPT